MGLSGWLSDKEWMLSNEKWGYDLKKCKLTAFICDESNCLLRQASQKMLSIRFNKFM